MQHCGKCHHNAKLLTDISKIAHVDYYRCEACGHVWTSPKLGHHGASRDVMIAEATAHAR